MFRVRQPILQKKYLNLEYLLTFSHSFCKNLGFLRINLKICGTLEIKFRDLVLLANLSNKSYFVFYWRVKTTVTRILISACSLFLLTLVGDAFGGAKVAQNNQVQMSDTEKKADSKGNEMTTAIPTDLTHIEFQTIDGDTTSLDQFAGKVKLIVNVASKCGYTKQYAGLEALYRKFADRGFVVIGFPANNFGNQEPGSNEEILEFCTSTYDVTFPMMAKISVKGADIHPLYAYLTAHSEPAEEIGWNFNKFLLDGEDRIIARWPSAVEPTSDEIAGLVEKILKQEAQEN